MGLISKIAIFFALVSTGFAFAEPCKIVQTEDPRGNPRIAKIEFPDGRKLTLVGQYHGFREDMLKLAQLPIGVDYLDQVRTLVQKPSTQEALVYFREDRAIVRTAIKDGVEFVGMEMAPTSVTGWRKATLAVRDRLLRVSAQSGHSDPALISSATLALQGAPNALSIEEPGLFRKVKIIGVEDADKGNAELAILPKYNKSYADFYQVIAGDRAAITALSHMDDEMMFKIYPIYDPAKPHIDFQIVEQHVAKTPAKYRAALRRHLYVQMDWFKTLFARDQQTTLNLLAQKKSGIAFMGGAHIVPIMMRLKQACLQDNERPGPPLSLVSEAFR